jgi:hypothetical protein
MKRSDPTKVYHLSVMMVNAGLVCFGVILIMVCILLVLILQTQRDMDNAVRSRNQRFTEIQQTLNDIRDRPCK